MKINMEDAPESVCQPEGVQVNNVYRNQHGKLYLIVAVNETRGGSTNGIALRIEKDGTITNACCYGTCYFERLQLVGKCDLQAEINVEWLTP